MKRTVTLIITCIVLCISTNISLGQKFEDSLFSNNTILDGRSLELVKTFEVSEDMKSLSLVIESKVEKGSVIIAITDPNKNNRGRIVVYSKDYPNKKIGPFFSIDTLKVRSDKSKPSPPTVFNVALTKIQKRINLPIKGNWSVRIKSNEGVGNVSIKTTSN